MRKIPTTTELNETITNDFNSTLNLSSNPLKRVLNGFAAVLSGKFRLLYLFLSDIQSNVFPDTADVEANGGTLERHGRIQLGRNPRPATVGVFNISVTGVENSVLRSGLTFKSNETALNPGMLFILDAAYTLSGTDDVVTVRALGVGTGCDLDVTDQLTITEPVIGVNQTAAVIEVLTPPRASETIEVYRQAILDAIQLEPTGGSKTDYRLWASDVQGVRKVYPYVKNGFAGVVQVYVEATAADSTDDHGTPSGNMLDDVYDVIQFDPDETRPLNERGRRPIQAILEVLPISLIPVDVVIAGLEDDSVAVKAAIRSSMEAYLDGVRPYIAGADLVRDKNDILYAARLQSVATDVLESANFFTDFTMDANGVNVSTYTFTLGNIPFLRNVNYA